MPSLQHRLRLVNRLGDAAALAALSEALEHAEVDECPALAAALLERPCDPVIGILIRRWHDLDEDARTRVAAIAGRNPARLCSAARSPQPRERRNALKMIGRLGLIQGLDEAVENLHHADPLVARPAADAIDRIVLGHLNSTAPAEDRKADDQHLDEAMVLALDGFPKHRQTGVLVAAARLLPAPGPALKRWLGDRDHPTHMAMRGFMKRLPDAELAPLLLNWLGIEPLGTQALEHVARLAVTKHFADMIRGRWHLLDLPEQASRLRRLDPRRPAAPPSAIALEMDDQAQTALPAWILAVPMSDEQRLIRLNDGLSFRSPRARLAAFRALTTFRDPRAEAIIIQFCFDEDERLARLAVMHCIRERVDGLPDVLRRLLRSPHRAVRVLAAAHAHKADFESIWSHWSGGGPSVEHRLRARLMMREQPQLVVAEVRTRLAARQRETCLRAIRLAGDLQILAEVELELLALARSADVRVSATAIKALGMLDSESSRSALVAGLQHADVRTRANAIEVLAPPLVETCRATLETITASPDNRPRANAIAAIARIDRADAAARLEAMLTDPRPLHRLSALWAADAMALTQCATRVADLARQDVSRPVRDRARRTARRLLAAMTAHHATPVVERAADVEPAEMKALRDAPPRVAAGAVSHLLVLPLLPATLAQSSTRLSEISRSFVDRGANWSWLDGSWLAPVLAATGVIAATLIALRWSIHDAQRHGPAYRAIASGLKLTRRERRLLNAVAVRSGRTNAAGLLLSRGTFDHCISQWRENGAKPDDRRIDKLTALRGRVFG